MEDLAKSVEIGSSWQLAQAFLGFFVLIGGRYVIVAGLAYAVCWRWLARRLASRRIQGSRPHATRVGHEIFYSLGSAALNAVVATGLLVAERLGWTRLYWDLGEHGVGYALGSFVFLLLAHDTYFYWLHRWLHLPRIFARFHGVHHRSRNPTPWAAFSFHPVEAVAQGALFPVVAWLVPLHVGVLLVFLAVALAINIWGHLGYELSPRRIGCGALWWIHTPTHHNLHHTEVRANFGLYFNFWDRLLGTNSPSYRERLDAIRRAA